MNIANFYSNGYQLVGINNKVLNNQSFSIGINNITGGYQMNVTGFDAANRELTIPDADLGKLSVGMELFLYTVQGDKNAPHHCKIAKLETGKITLVSDLDIEEYLIREPISWIAAVPNINNLATNLAVGDGCFATGEYSTAMGTYSLASGFGSTAMGICSEARGEVSIAAGNMSVATGLVSVAIGTNAEANGMFSLSLGASTKAVADNSLAMGTGSEATGDNASAIGFHSKASGRLAVAIGGTAQAHGDYSFALGYQVETTAKNSFVFGKHGELNDAVENIGAFAFATGDVNNKQIGLLIQSCRAELNPLYGVAAGEAQYLPVIDPTITYKGHLLADTTTLSGSDFTMDHSTSGRWKITPQTNVIPILKNWRDGDQGDLIIYGNLNMVLFPSSWIWMGEQPTANSINTFVFIIRQIDDKIVIKHEVTL